MAARAMEKLHVSVPAGWIWLSPVLWQSAVCSDPRLVSSRRYRRVSTSRTPGWSCATPTVARPGCSPSHWRRASLPHSRWGWLPGKRRPLPSPPLPRWPVHPSPIYLTFLPLCPVRGDAARSTETSVTSGEQPAAILGTSAATNTFQTRKARTGNPGSPELRHQHHHIDRDSSDAFACWKSVSPELTLTLRSRVSRTISIWAFRFQCSESQECHSATATSLASVKNKAKQRAIRNWNWIQLIQKFSPSCGKQ